MVQIVLNGIVYTLPDQRWSKTICLFCDACSSVFPLVMDKKGKLHMCTYHPGKQETGFRIPLGLS